jgi:predicted TPR repeat methyltransferase
VTMLGLGLAHLARKGPQDISAANFYFQKAKEGGLDSAELHLHRGTALLLSGRVDEAIESLNAALAKRSDLAEGYRALSASYRMKGDGAATRRWLAAALQYEPQNPQAWMALGILEQEAGRWDEAEGLFRGVIGMKPDYAPAYEALAKVLERRGFKLEAEAARESAQDAAQRAQSNASPNGDAPTSAADPHEAIVALQQRLNLSEEQKMGHFALAAHSKFAPPGKIPDQTLVDLFDRYADKFDHHLHEKLEYHVPELIAQAVSDLKPDRPLDVLDLGCGTGLCGHYLKPMAGQLWGIDLAPLMIAKSKSRGIYDRLELGELVEVMKRIDQKFDVIVAGDVLIYNGELAPIYEAAVARLRPGGRLIASFEAAAGDRFVLGTKTLRYSHSRPYLKRMADIFGFVEERIDDITVRKENQVPVKGYLVVLKLRERN